jgi:hypothetical protein
LLRSETVSRSAGGAKAMLLDTGDLSDEIGTLFHVTYNGRRTQIADNTVGVAIS